jgi:hypothetical protein
MSQKCCDDCKVQYKLATGGGPQGAMHVTSQIWQVVFPSQTLQVFCLALRKRAQYVVVLMEGLTYEEEDVIFETKLKQLSIGTITFLEETVLLLNVGVSKIKSIEEFDPEQGTLDQIVVKGVPSIVKLKDFFL